MVCSSISPQVACGDGGCEAHCLETCGYVFLVNTESSTNVSAHLHVETIVFVSRDI